MADRLTPERAHAPGLLAEAQKIVAADGEERFAAPNLGFALFERAWSLRGFDLLLMDMVDRPAWVEDLLRKLDLFRTRFTGQGFCLPLHRLASALLMSLAVSTFASDHLRPPAVPIVTHDPYFSIWSPADQLTDADTIHWTGKPRRLTSLVRIDGKAFRLMGTSPTHVPPLPQTWQRVNPTQTHYVFAGEGVVVALDFMTPALPEDTDLLARPVGYVTWHIESTDGKPHAVQLYFDAAAEIVVNEPRQEVVWAREDIGDLVAVKVRSNDQPILEKKGDDLRIDWGCLYVAAERTSAEPVVAS
ncbi:MAG TPA: DUF5127 domain-containing protein [Verrucomicrobiota bacterium]|jgi:hypothetical protein|nr:MAG: hypothetical protein BWX48_00368 [Verrucomicrobia bacterium ADurb.Bin006]HOR70152.1 DUF5127 domain-containing protein [Verrucomicrobiota bacterium]HPW79512.1 DUF5127 domain-containing protein [Verrucomicrobiota bacterium]HQJ99364.1 DUF5127 domain-containing protein [Verrucomicrobiota bacterium]